MRPRLVCYDPTALQQNLKQARINETDAGQAVARTDERITPALRAFYVDDDLCRFRPDQGDDGRDVAGDRRESQDDFRLASQAHCAS